MARWCHLLLAVLACCCCCCFRLGQASSLSDSVQPLYGATEKFLDFIQPADWSLLLQEIVPALIDRDRDISQIWRSNDWARTSLQYVRHMLGFSVLIGIGLCLIALVPLVGCCVCCCRCCCGNCGGRLSMKERKGAACARGSYGFCLLLMASLLLFGAVLAFVSNQLLRDQLRSSSSSSNSSVIFTEFSAGFADVIAALEEAPGRGRLASTAAVSTTASALRPSVNRTLALLQADLSHGGDVNAIGAIRSIEAALSRLAYSQKYADAFASNHTQCVDRLTTLNETMASLRDNLTQPVAFVCPTGAAPADCDVVNASLPGLRSEVNSDNFGYETVSELSGRLAKFNVSEMRLRLAEASAALENITVAGMSMVDTRLAEAIAALNDSQLMKVWSNMDSYIQTVARDLRRTTDPTVIRVTNPLTQAANQSLADVVFQFDAYRYYSFIGLASFFLLLIALFYCGLLYGCAGQPPHEDSGCCNRGAGANCLLAGASLAWLLYALLMLLVMLGFLTGGLVDTQACRYLTGRAGAPGYRMLDELATTPLLQLKVNGFNLSAAATDAPVSALLTGCTTTAGGGGRHNGSLAGSLVDVAGLSSALRLPTLVDDFLNTSMRQLAQSGADLLSGGAALDPGRLEEVAALARNASAVDFSGYATELARPLSVANLTALTIAMQRIANDTSDAAAAARFAELRDGLQTAWVDAAVLAVPMQRFYLDLLVLGLGQLNASMAGLPRRVADADAALRSEEVLLAALETAAAGLADEVVGLAESQLMPRLLDQTLSCGRLGAGLNRAIAAPCTGLLRPFNGYWAGLGICLLALLPCLVLAIKLANLYRKKQKYLADFDDGCPKPV